jgi:hypothetical protein
MEDNIKVYLKELGLRCRSVWFSSGWGNIAESNEHNKQHSAFMKGDEYLGYSSVITFSTRILLHDVDCCKSVVPTRLLK